MEKCYEYDLAGRLLKKTQLAGTSHSNTGKLAYKGKRSLFKNTPLPPNAPACTPRCSKCSRIHCRIPDAAAQQKSAHGGNDMKKTGPKAKIQTSCNFMNFIVG